MKSKIWWVLLPVFAISLLGWGAWATLGVADATPKEVFDAHVEKARDRYDTQQKEIVNKLDDIQKTILDLHK